MGQIKKGILAAALVALVCRGVIAAPSSATSLSEIDFEQQVDVSGILTEIRKAVENQSAERRGSARAQSQVSSTSQANRLDGPIIEPGTEDRAYASCSDQGKSPQPWNVCLSIEAVAAGGHAHTEGIPPVHVMDPICRRNIPGNTKVFWRWRAPEFASRLNFTWVYSGWCNDTNTGAAETRIQGLAALGNGNGYELVGQTPRHPANHYGTADAVVGLRTIAARYRREFPGDPKLLFNDISLEWGGLFDLNGDWAKPHSTHRRGSQADVQRDSVPEAHRARLEQISADQGARVLIEGSHYHLDFTPAGSPHYEERLSCY